MTIASDPRFSTGLRSWKRRDASRSRSRRDGRNPAPSRSSFSSRAERVAHGRRLLAICILPLSHRLSRKRAPSSPCRRRRRSRRRLLNRERHRDGPRGVFLSKLVAANDFPKVFTRLQRRDHASYDDLGAHSVWKVYFIRGNCPPVKLQRSFSIKWSASRRLAVKTGSAETLRLRNSQSSIHVTDLVGFNLWRFLEVGNF